VEWRSFLELSTFFSFGFTFPLSSSIPPTLDTIPTIALDVYASPNAIDHFSLRNYGVQPNLICTQYNSHTHSRVSTVPSGIYVVPSAKSVCFSYASSPSKTPNVVSRVPNVDSLGSNLSADTSPTFHVLSIEEFA